jgi:L-serine dehydratase
MGQFLSCCGVEGFHFTALPASGGLRYHTYMAHTRSIFDIIGPAMVGPSSSHTAGAVRLGALARAIFGGQPELAVVKLHGSFDATGVGHGTKLALVAGLLGLRCDDPRIADSFALAESFGLQFIFESVHIEGEHPNTAVFVLENPSTGKAMTVVGSSVGGGNVLVTRIDDFEVEINGNLPSIVAQHNDVPGVIYAASAVLAHAGINIAGMKVARERRGARALMLIECDKEPDLGVVAELKALPNINKARVVPSIGF